MKKPRILNVNLLADFYPMWPIAAEMISISSDRNKLWCSKPLGLSADLTLYNCQMRRDFKLDFTINLLCQFAEARRSHQIEQLTRERRQQHSQQMTEWKKRYLEKQNEATRRAHEDSVKHLQVTDISRPGPWHALHFFMLHLQKFREEKKKRILKTGTPSCSCVLWGYTL